MSALGGDFEVIQKKNQDVKNDFLVHRFYLLNCDILLPDRGLKLGAMTKVCGWENYLDGKACAEY